MNPLQLLRHQENLRTQCPEAPPALSGDLPPLHVTLWGEGGAPALIIHGGVQGGLGGGPLTFAAQQVLGTQGFEIRLPDRPGFGKSSTRGPDDMEADAVWIADLLGDGAHLVGHSWGGAGALLAAAKRPTAVGSLVLVEPALQSLLMTAPEDPELAAGQRDAGANVARLLETTTPGAYGTVFAENLGGAGKASNTALKTLQDDPTRAARLGCALLHSKMASPQSMYQAAAAVAAARIPVLVISGGWSAAFDAVAVVTARLTGGRHMIVRSPDHFPQATAADAFNAAVVDFWKSADAGTEGAMR